ncbi:metalloregulator ArsR/SmtB family transcription factor [Hyalangium sp.]|uniref:ArsR/SmtB family transcription factor n=1 Tax=Hyalangium sp. TaxID=2028555 RepID=UPI002D395B77|nr:metalloregulator ArsR/SmtB family transcription factor [Hyalangium sp.]HYH99911.1 metalloregulator ArsR/SmtB family transcription factor [Hyalangium sp.]
MIQTLTALGEPNRLRIVELLRAGPCPVGEIGDRLQLRQPQVSKHLRVLKKAGLVQMQPRAQQRLYELRAEPLRELDTWLEPYRRYWNARLDALERHLEIMDTPVHKRRRRPPT